MQFTRQGSEGILAGRVTVTFRNWQRPHAAVGGVYRLRPAGAVKVTDIRTVRVSEVDDEDARRAGFDDAAALAAFLDLPPAAQVTRVGFELTAPPPATSPPALSPEEALARLQATDRRSREPWTAVVLALIRDHPATRAGDLAPRLGWETQPFKANVRKLKALGLTQSLETGYRLTELGERVAAALPALARRPR